MTEPHFDPALVDLIARGLPALPHPDGTPLVFPAHADTFPGYTDDEQQTITTMNRHIAEAILNYLQLNSHQIVTDQQLAQPQQFGDHTVITGHCATCAAPVLHASMDRDGRFTIAPRTINPDCETRHGATT